MLDQVGYDINWRQLTAWIRRVEPIPLQPLTASTKLTGLAPLHHDRESTLPTHFLRSDRVAVLRQTERAKKKPKYQPEIAGGLT